MEAEHRIMIGQGAVMFAVLFFLAWQGGVHWLLAVLIALFLIAPVLIAIEGVRYYVESRAEAEEEGEGGSDELRAGAQSEPGNQSSDT